MKYLRTAVDFIHLEDRSLLGGLRLGLITNHTGVNRCFSSTASSLAKEFDLTALFAPEHGIRGDRQAGVAIEDAIDPILQLPVFSLHGKTKRIPDRAWDLIDAVVYDICDVGARFYTYLSSLAYAMEDAKKHSKKVIVFDRPNPLGRKVEGLLLGARFFSFVGLYPIPARYGLSVGEYANYINNKCGIGCDLLVVPYRWEVGQGDNLFSSSLFVPPSPNIPTLDAAYCYIGTCIFEGTNISEGRGTALPFQLTGAPFLDGQSIAANLNRLFCDKGIVFRDAHFTPLSGKFAGEMCHGVQMHITNRITAEPFAAGLSLFEEIRKQCGEKLVTTPHIYNILGDDKYIIGDDSLEETLERARHDCAWFSDDIKEFYLYDE